VLTGTVLSGKCAVGQTVEFPELKVQKKIKSMQMFRKPVNVASQGDRVAIRVTQLDAKQMERGLVADPGTVPTISAAVVDVNRVRFFKFPIKSKAKFHVTVGHQTVMASFQFFTPVSGGGADAPVAPVADAAAAAADAPAVASLTRAAEARVFSFDRGVECLSLDDLDADEAATGPLWALATFETPVTCPHGSVYIASRLDADAHGSACRVAFHGRLGEAMNPADKTQMAQLRVYKTKEKKGNIKRVVDANVVIVKDLFRKETDLSAFFNLKVSLPDGRVGTITAAFGTSGQVRVEFRDGHDLQITESKSERKRRGKAAAAAAEPAPQEEQPEYPSVFLRFKKYVFVTHNNVVQ